MLLRLAFAALIIGVHAICSGEDISSSLRFVPEDVNGVLHIEKPDEVRQKLMDIGLLELLDNVDKEAPKHDEAERSFVTYKELAIAISSADDITVLTRTGDGVCIVFRCTSPLDQLAETLRTIQIDESTLHLFGAFSKSFLEKQADVTWSVKCVNDKEKCYCIAANQPEFCEAVVSLIANKSGGKRLVEKRIFQRISTVIGNEGGTGFFVFANGDVVENLFYNEENIAINRMSDCIPAFGGKLEFRENYLVADFVGARTLPSNGLTLVYDAFIPISKFPQFAVSPTEIEGFSFDPLQYWESRVERYDRVHGPGSLRNKVANEMNDGKDGFFYFRDCIPATKATYLVKWKHQSNLKRHFTLFHMHERDAQMRWFEAIRDGNEKHESLRFSSEKIGKVDIWFPDDASFFDYVKARQENPVPEAENSDLKARIEKGDFVRFSYAIGEEWSCQGDYKTVEAQMDLLENDNGVSHNDEFNELKAELERLIDYRPKPIKFWYSKSAGYIVPVFFDDARKLVKEQEIFESSRQTGTAAPEKALKAGSHSLEHAFLQFLNEKVQGTFFAITNEESFMRGVGVVRLGPR